LALLGATTGHLVSKQSRKLLPLAALLKMTLAFPDRAPSRMALALRIGSSKQRQIAIEQFRNGGLSDDPQAAAEHVIGLVATLHKHDRLTRGHVERVRAWAHVIGQELGLTEIEQNQLRWAAMLHDIGKLAVPSEILNKPGRPDEAEWAILATHPAEGEKRIQSLVPFLGEWTRAVGEHHERWNGKGYPKGLAGEEISLSARIVAVADSFEVMTAVRSYKKSQPLSEARAELVRCSGSDFDPQVVRALLTASQAKNVGWLAGLISSAKALAEPLSAVALTAATVLGSVGAGVAGQSAAQARELTKIVSVQTNTVRAAKAPDPKPTQLALGVTAPATDAIDTTVGEVPTTQQLVSTTVSPAVGTVDSTLPSITEPDTADSRPAERVVEPAPVAPQRTPKPAAKAAAAEAPDSAASKTTIPDTTLPVTTLPDTTLPVTTLPDTKAPNTTQTTDSIVTTVATPSPTTQPPTTLPPTTLRATNTTTTLPATSTTTTTLPMTTTLPTMTTTLPATTTTTTTATTTATTTLSATTTTTIAATTTTKKCPPGGGFCNNTTTIP
jgi:HD-GYP domain-containing protein (c-di-GMP phosphodiesterase class II)